MSEDLFSIWIPYNSNVAIFRHKRQLSFLNEEHANMLYSFEKVWKWEMNKNWN